MNESFLAIEAAFQEDAVEVGVEPDKVSRRGIGDHGGTLDPPAGSLVGEALDHAVDESADLAEKQRAFLGTGRTQMEDLAAKRSEVVRFTFRIGALDPRDALRVVPAIQEAFHGLRDALPAEPAQPCGELRIVSRE